MQSSVPRLLDSDSFFIDEYPLQAGPPPYDKRQYLHLYGIIQYNIDTGDTGTIPRASTETDPPLALLGRISARDPPTGPAMRIPTADSARSKILHRNYDQCFLSSRGVLSRTGFVYAWIEVEERSRD